MGVSMAKKDGKKRKDSYLDLEKDEGEDQKTLESLEPPKPILGKVDEKDEGKPKEALESPEPPKTEEEVKPVEEEPKKESIFDSDEKIEKEESIPLPKKNKPKPRKKLKKVKEHVETDVDKLYELVKKRGLLKVRAASKELSIETDQIEEWGRILEEHKLVKLHYPAVGEPVLILKKFKSDISEIKEKGRKKKLKPRRRVFLINLVILLGFMGFIAFHTVGIETIRISYTQVYLALAVIIIIGAVLIVKYRKSLSRSNKK